MTDYSMIMIVLQGIVVQGPVLLACLAGGIIVLLNWRQIQGAGIWALLGFGIGGLLCFLVPLTQAIMQHMIATSATSGTGYRPSTAIFTGLALLWSVLRAASYGFLLAAVVAGRFTPRPDTTLPPLR